MSAELNNDLQRVAELDWKITFPLHLPHPQSLYPPNKYFLNLIVTFLYAIDTTAFQSCGLFAIFYCAVSIKAKHKFIF